MGKQFEWTTLARKMSATLIAVLAVAVVAIQSVPVPETVNAWSDWTPWFTAVGIVIARGLWNIYKTRLLVGNPLGKILQLAIVGMLGTSLMLTGCITTTTTLPDGSVTVTREIDIEALATLPGLIGDLGVELARIEAALDDVDETAPPTADELAMRARRQEILDRLLEAGIEVIQNADTAKG